MTLLILGLVLFLGVHSIAIAAPAWRDAMAARNDKAWKGAYALLSIAGFVLLVYGYGLARQSPLVIYTPPAGLRHLALLLLLPVFPLLFAAYLPGRIQAASKHPMLVATKLWALAHLLANGTLADVLLFGGFLAWAVAERISLKRRVARPVPGAPPSAANDAIAVVAGLVVYGLFVWRVHAWLIGVSPL
ncbi:MAG TPA: NnrU family protein [Rhizobacter sp.]|nr:NnrU family protein [Rhizobacter sp.]